MIFDYNLLKSKIRAKGYTYCSFAKELGISNSTLTEKLNNKQPFKVVEIMKSKELLKLENVDDYFFVLSA